MKTEKAITTRDIIICFIGAVAYFIVQGIISLFSNSVILHTLLNNLITMIFIFIAIMSFLKSRRLEKGFTEVRNSNYNFLTSANNLSDRYTEVFQNNNQRCNNISKEMSDLRKDLKDDFKYLILKSRLHGRGLDWDMQQESVNSKNYIQTGYTDAEREYLRNHKPKFFLT